MLAVFLLVAATVAVYWPVSGHDFVLYDDPGYVTKNIHVRTGLSPENISWAFFATEEANWHPLTWLSHMADCELFGLDAGLHHLSGLLLHIINALLLLLVLKGMTGMFWPAFLVAALFAIHPLHVESVAWVAERKDLLSTLFMLLALQAYLRYTERPGIGRHLFCLLFFALGLMAKPMLVTLPFLLLLLDFWPLGRTRPDSRTSKNRSSRSPPPVRNAEFSFSRLPYLLLEKVPFFALSAVSCVITYTVQKSGGAVKSSEIFPFIQRLTNAFCSYAQYAVDMFLPRRLCVYYPHQGASIDAWKWIVSAVLLACVTASAVFMWRRRPYILTGWLWYLGTLVPVIGLVQVGRQAMADRYTYVPMIGLFVAIAWIVASFAAALKRARIPLVVFAATALCALGFSAGKQVGYWKNSTVLFENCLDNTNENFIAHNNLGIALETDGRHDEAFYHFEEAIRIAPEYQDAHVNMGVALSARGRMDEAESFLKRAVELDPGDARAIYNLANTLLKKGDRGGAVKAYRAALDIDPDHANTHNNLGIALTGAGRTDEAVFHFREAIRLDPAGSFQAMDNLAWTLATRPGTNRAEANEAVRLALAVSRMTGHGDARILDTLAAAYAAAGRFDEAVETAKKAADLAARSGIAGLEEGIRERIGSYKKRRPWRKGSRIAGEGRGED